MIDPSARTLTAGDLRAVFLPGHGMLGASLRHHGEELLGRVDEIEPSLMQVERVGSRYFTPGRTVSAARAIKPQDGRSFWTPPHRFYTSLTMGIRYMVYRRHASPGK
jgi:hypothetical protein